MVKGILRRRFWIAVIAGLWGAGAQAAWQFVPNINISARTQDNVRLAPGDVPNQDATSSVVDAELTLSTFSQRGYVTFDPRISVNLYADQFNGDLDGNDIFLRGRGEYEWQRVTIGFRTDYRKRAVIRAELAEIEEPDFDDDSDIDDPDDVDTGRLIAIEQDQIRYTLRPRLDYELSERSTFRFEALTTEVSYSDFNVPGRTGFQDNSFRVGVIRRANERNRVTATLVVDDYDSELNGNSTDTVGVVGRIDRRLSDLWRLDFSVGLTRSDFIYFDDLELVDNASVDYSFDVRTRRRGERTQLEFRAGHRLNPSASGYVVKRNQLRFYIDHQLTQRLFTRIGFRVEEIDSVGGAAPQNDRDYKRAEVSFSWALTEKWRLWSGYDFLSQEFVNQSTGSRSSNMIFIGVGYQGLSRPEAP
ncbi:MAG TPA: hypothetical protein VMR74_16900 [Gammaproteobacteria bacterium]|nr:hypothetical protein [Gammaproteobacteria bacterium]